MKVKVNTNYDKRTIGELNSGDVFVTSTDGHSFPYMITDNDYVGSESDKCLCVCLINGYLYTFKNSEEVVAVKNVELNYDL